MYCQMHLARRQADGLAPVMEKQIGGKTIERTPTIGELESGAHPESVADHIMSHISEGYIMASVAYNALTHPRSQVAPAYMWAAFTGPDGQTFPDHGDYIKKRVAKVIYEYLCRQLQLTK